MKKDMSKPFDMRIPPKKQNPFLLPVIWIGSYLLTRKNRLKIERRLRGIKPPFLVLVTHQGFSDYYIAPLALFPHRANYVSDMEGFWAFGEWVYRSIGCIGKRRFVPDINVLINLKKCVQRGNTVVVYPESRHCNAGITSNLPVDMGKLAKYLDIPVVILSVHGSYLESPLWDEEYSRRAPITAKLECIYTKEEMQNAGEEEIQEKIEQALAYNEYAWQQENKILLKRTRANGLHKVLYRCPRCENDFTMVSIAENGSVVSDMEDGEKSKKSGVDVNAIGIRCENCKSVWELTALGELKYHDKEYFLDIGETVNPEKKMYQNDKIANMEKRFDNIPIWYNWQRDCAVKEWEAGTKKVSFCVHVEALPNSCGFTDLGDGILELNQNEFVLTIQDQKLVFPHRIRESVQTEYNYKGKGMCVVLSTKDNCYYIYSKDTQFNPTWIQFVGEYLYQQCNWKMILNNIEDLT